MLRGGWVPIWGTYRLCNKVLVLPLLVRALLWKWTGSGGESVSTLFTVPPHCAEPWETHHTHANPGMSHIFIFLHNLGNFFFFLDLNLLTIYCGSSGTVSFLLLISWGYFSVPTLFYWWCFVCFHLPSPPVPAVSRGTLCLFLEHIQLLSPTVFSIDINCISNMHNSA